MRQHEKDDVLYYTFDLLDAHPELRHAVFGTKGPGGRPFNLSVNKGQREETEDNLRLAASILGLPYPLYLMQAHGAGVLVLSDTKKNPTLEELGDAKIGDAIIGGIGQSLLIKIADCQGIILYDPVTKALGLVHSGWRGSTFNIIGRCVDALVARKGVKPQNILACVSPSLGPCCMEFKDWKDKLPEWAWAYRKENEHMDFWAMSVDQLKKAGVLEKNIELSGVCTKCSEGFFSHRRGEDYRFGVMAGVLYV
ncbi:MAG: polyphenol oxidase family protein [Deltaproteobacteria bacterium]|nr:polyphenol oxidase family protein [Deltaproteobacteria bacterium]